jgi:hypothetical protein
MSTIVSNGYRLRAGTDLFEFQQEFRSLLSPARLQEDMKILAGLATQALWNALSDGVDPGDDVGSLGQALSQYEKQQSVRNVRSFRDDPNRCNVLIGRMLRGQHLVGLKCENPRLREIFESMDVVSEYGFDGRTDGAPEFAPTEWQQRQTDWESLVPGDAELEDVSLAVTLRAEPVYSELNWAVWDHGNSEHRGMWERAIADSGAWNLEHRLAGILLTKIGAPGGEGARSRSGYAHKAHKLVRDAGLVAQLKGTLPPLTLELLTAETATRPDWMEQLELAVQPLTDRLDPWAEGYK